jgi:hypothetical protein
MHLVERIDDYGKAAWIALMVLGFIIWWPVGLAILGFLLWSRRMSCGHRGAWGGWQRERWGRGRWHGGMQRQGRGNTGNAAFDAYREETLRRLEDEQRQFTEYLENLRHAKDKSEFDQFMAERRNRPATPPTPPSPDISGPDGQS